MVSRTEGLSPVVKAKDNTSFVENVSTRPAKYYIKNSEVTSASRENHRMANW